MDATAIFVERSLIEDMDAALFGEIAVAIIADEELKYAIDALMALLEDIEARNPSEDALMALLEEKKAAKAAEELLATLFEEIEAAMFDDSEVT
jgi:hypothetical protein